MKSKLKIIVPVLLLVLGGAYKFVLAKPKAVAAKPKVEGTVYVMPKDFLLNLKDGKFAKLSVALVMKPAAGGGGGGHGAPAAEPPEGYGADPQEAIVRDIVTDVLTETDGEELTSKKGRKHLKEEVLERIHKETDVHAADVLFTDVAVQ